MVEVQGEPRAHVVLLLFHGPGLAEGPIEDRVASDDGDALVLAVHELD
jgi:hypothetical protein